MSEVIRKKISRKTEKGGALPMVLLVTFLLLAASAALLNTAGGNVKNTADALSESKAYYIAESGTQAAINILRNTSPAISYKDAVNATPPNLSTWRSTNWTSPDGTAGYSLGTDGGGYTISVSDPDDSQHHIQFTTDTTDTVGNNSSGFGINGTTFAAKVGFPDTTSANRTEFSWVPNNQPAQLFNGNPNVKVVLGSFKAENIGTGVAVTQKIYFRINLRLVAPDNPTWVIKGTIDPSLGFRIVYQSYLYSMVGSDQTLCSEATCAAPVNPNVNLQVIAPPAINTTGSLTTPFWVQLTPKEPQRLLLTSVGYGPNRARKQLQAVIHKSFFPLVPPAAGLLMNGPNALFDNGSGQPHYYGCDPDDPAVCVPSIGATDSSGLTNINNATFKDLPNPDPPPAIVGENLPDWQKTPSAMDQFINETRLVTPANSIYPNGAVINTGGYGDFATGKGLTFCDGDCTVQGSGGGILIAKGKLTLKGGVSFRGYIIVVGADGMLRDGAGGPGDQIIGGVVIAPYILTPLPNGTWLQPKYSANGGGNSYIKYSSLDYLFDGGITGTTNFVSGVAEK